MKEKEYPEVGGRSAKIALVLLVIVYIFNFVDRQILSVLAEEIKADLNISDSDLGFLFGTAFAVFYSIFGIPLGKLADVWSRKNILSIGLATWSIMTALSGTAKSFTSLSIFRVGVGIGESSASPASYSLLSDYFSPKIRTTILAIYSSGVYLGAGIGLFLGGWIVELWTSAYPLSTNAPFGLKAWQAAFIIVGLPGVILAFFTWNIKEPKRGGSEGIESQIEPHPFKVMFKEFIGISPLGLINSDQPMKLLSINILIGIIISLICFGLYRITGDTVQWVAFGIGIYFLTCWIQGLKSRDPVTFEMIFKTKSFLLIVIGFPFISFITYSMAAFGPSFYMRNYGITEAEVATILGLITAFSGSIGVIGGGIIADKLRKKYTNGRLYVGLAVVVFGVPAALAFLYADNLYASYVYYSIFQLITPMWVGIAPATVSDLVLPRMRGLASAFYLLMVSMIGLALGPYCIGKLSDVYQSTGYSSGEALRAALSMGLFALIITTITLVLACYYLPRDESSKVERAKALGEI